MRAVLKPMLLVAATKVLVLLGCANRQGPAAPELLCRAADAKIHRLGCTAYMGPAHFSDLVRWVDHERIRRRLVAYLREDTFETVCLDAEAYGLQEFPHIEEIARASTCKQIADLLPVRSSQVRRIQRDSRGP